MRTEKEIDNMIKRFSSEHYQKEMDEDWYSEAFIGILEWVKGQGMTHLVIDDEPLTGKFEDISN